MSEFLIGLIGVNLFALFAPFLLIAAAIWGSADEQEFMRVAFWVVSPLTVFFWYCGLHIFVSFWRGFFEGIRLWRPRHV
jgi:hypothetical protein